MPTLGLEWGIWNWMLIPALAVGYGIIASGWNYLTRNRRAKQHANDEYYNADTNTWYGG